MVATACLITQGWLHSNEHGNYKLSDGRVDIYRSLLRFWLRKAVNYRSIEHLRMGVFSVAELSESYTIGYKMVYGEGWAKFRFSV